MAQPPPGGNPVGHLCLQCHSIAIRPPQQKRPRKILEPLA